MAPGPIPRSYGEDISKLWEEVLLVKGTIEEWPYGPCAKQIEKIYTQLSETLELHKKQVNSQLTNMLEQIKVTREETFSVQARAMETQKSAQAAINATNDHLKEYEARIRMMQDANNKMAEMWDSVLKTIGYKLEYVPAKFEVTKLDKGD